MNHTVNQKSGKSLLLILFVVVWILSLTSCSETCPKFDEGILSWIPYQENDVIELYSKSNDSTIILSVKSVVITHTTRVSFGTKCECGDDIQINQDNYDNSNFHVFMYLYGSKIGSQTYRIYDSYFSTYSEIKKFLFENEEYDIVRIFDNDTYSKGMFKKLIIAKDIGIIGLIDICDNTWTLKTGAKSKSLDKKGIEINNVSC